MPYVNLAVVREQLFLHPKVVARLCRDFALPTPASPDELARSLVVAFGQVPTLQSFSAANSSDRVFRAAVFALASNSRRWSRFPQVELQVRAKLHSYDPSMTAQATDPLRSTEIASLLGGITAKADSAAVEGLGTAPHTGSIVCRTPRPVTDQHHLIRCPPDAGARGCCLCVGLRNSPSLC